MKQILIATGNMGKLREIQEFFEEFDNTFQEKIEFLTLNDFEKIEEPDETGATYEENALQKAQFYGKKFGLPTISEDAGLVLEEFPDKFGLKTRREIDAKTDEEWMEKFLEMLENAESRRAKFFSAMSFFDPHKSHEQTFLGECSGSICETPQAKFEAGIPVSSVFLVDNETEVFSQMPKTTKNRISHRGKSAQQMIDFLEKYFD